MTQRWRPSRSLVSVPLRDAHVDASPSETLTAPGDVVGPVGVQLGRSGPALSTRASDQRDGIDDLLKHGAVMACAPVKRVARGMPWRSTITCRLVPDLPRSV